jgi:hypothetical protein
MFNYYLKNAGHLGVLRGLQMPRLMDLALDSQLMYQCTAYRKRVLAQTWRASSLVTLSHRESLIRLLPHPPLELGFTKLHARLLQPAAERHRLWSCSTAHAISLIGPASLSYVK